MTTPPAPRTALLTGAASARGIGRAVAHRLAREGWAIGLLDLDGDAVEDLAARLRSEHGVPAAAARVDVADPSAVTTALATLEDRLPPVRALATLAGISDPTPYLEVTPEQWGRVVDVNLHGVHHVAQGVARAMAARAAGRAPGERTGSIVLISSVSAQRGGGTNSRTAYSVTKAGVIGLARSLARELGPYGVTVNAIAPGPIDTDIMGGPLTDDRKDELVRDLLVDRVGTTEDIAAAIAYLVGDDAGYVTGQTLNVDGGLYMH